MRVIYALWLRNFKTFLRNKTALIFNLISPFFFVYIFAGIFKHEGIGNASAFMLSGVIITMVFESTMRISASTIDDMTGGFMKEVLVSPISRLNIAIAQFISSATVATIQGLIIYVLGLFTGLSLSPSALLLTIPVMIFVGLVFSGLGLFIATKAKNIQTFQAVSLAVTMPLVFLSGAYIPLSLLPNAMQWFAYFNPLSYAVILFRAVTLGKLNSSGAELVHESIAFKIGSFTVTPIIAFGVLAVFGILFLFLSTISFLKVDFSKMNRNKKDLIDF
ncbi:MAG: ABC transporter permease [Firmicutes bacterium]|nr:ABC transporter permease [Bacillota bacterium]